MSLSDNSQPIFKILSSNVLILDRTLQIEDKIQLSFSFVTGCRYNYVETP